MKYILKAILLLAFIVSSTNSEGESFVFDKENSSVKIKGTSTVHDWEMGLEKFDFNAAFITEGSVLKVIDKVTFNCKSGDLKSDNSLMDKKTYAALKTVSFPEIKFSSTAISEIIPVNGGKFTGNMTGTLFLAGVSRSVSFPFSGVYNNTGNRNEISVNGSIELKMSDYNIIPPTALMGTLKTGEKVTVSFSLKVLQTPVK